MGVRQTDRKRDRQINKWMNRIGESVFRSLNQGKEAILCVTKLLSESPVLNWLNNV